MSDQFYDVVDSEGNVVETAQEQEHASNLAPLVEEGAQPDSYSGYVDGGDGFKIDHENKRVYVTAGELKKAHKLYVTIQHPKVIACGHRLDLSRPPRHRGCENCWFAWFNNHGEIVQQLDEMHVAGGDDIIVRLQGKKFLHRWKQFMATVAQMKPVENNE